MILPDCREARKEASHRTVYESAEGTGIKTNHKEHRLAKLEIYQALLQIPGVTDVRLERYLREIRPDVSFVWNGELVAIEIQLSQLSCEKIEWRTGAYAQRNIAVLWMPSFSMDLFEERYAPKDWERYLHRMYETWSNEA